MIRNVDTDYIVSLSQLKTVREGVIQEDLLPYSFQKCEFLGEGSGWLLCAHFLVHLQNEFSGDVPLISTHDASTDLRSTHQNFFAVHQEPRHPNWRGRKGRNMPTSPDTAIGRGCFSLPGSWILKKMMMFLYALIRNVLKFQSLTMFWVSSKWVA